MFNLPLPTDNLYKFVAIFGLVIVITCYILWNQTYKDYLTNANLFIENSYQLENDIAELNNSTAVYIPNFEPLLYPKETSADVDSSEYQNYIKELFNSYDWTFAN